MTTRDLLAPSGKSAKFETVGTVHKGTVIAREQRQQRDIATGSPKFWDNGDPMMEVVITLQTDDRTDPADDGVRNLYVRGNMLRAVREAVQRVQAPTVEIGGTLAVKYDRDGDVSKPGFSPPKLFVAQYKSPTVTGDDLIAGAGTPAATEVPAQQQPAVADDLI